MTILENTNSSLPNQVNSSFKTKNTNRDFIKKMQVIMLLALAGIGIAASYEAFSNTSMVLGVSIAGLATIFGVSHFFQGKLGKRKFSLITMTLLSLGFIAIASCFLAKGGLLTAVSAGDKVLALSILTGIVYGCFRCCSCQRFREMICS
ncbi:MAG: hypothetical protein R3E91_05690 [Chlamydiales bacterium]